MSNVKKLNAETLIRTITLEEELAWIDEAGNNPDFTNLCQEVLAVMQKLHTYPTGSFAIIPYGELDEDTVGLYIHDMSQLFFNYKSICEEFEIKLISEMPEDWTPRAVSKTIVIEDEEDETLVSQLFNRQEYVDLESQDEKDQTT